MDEGSGFVRDLDAYNYLTVLMFGNPDLLHEILGPFVVLSLSRNSSDEVSVSYADYSDDGSPNRMNHPTNNEITVRG